MRHEKFEIYTLKIKNIIWHYKLNSDYFWTMVYEQAMKYIKVNIVVYRFTIIV